MRHLLLAAIFTFGSASWGRTNNPELIDWQEFQLMTPDHQQSYLTMVSDALGEFEHSADEVFAADTFASVPYFKEIFAELIEESSTTAFADPGDGVNCGSQVSFAPQMNGGFVCVNVANKPGQQGKSGTYCTNSDDRSRKMFAAYQRKCPNEFQKTPNAQAALDRGVQLAGGKDPNGSAPKTIAPNSAAAAQTAGKGGMPAETSAKPRDLTVTTTAKGCSGVSGQKRKEMRAAYRDPKNSPAKCLIAGQESTYSEGANGRCKPVQEGKGADGKKVKCTAANTFGTDSKKAGKISAGRATMCNPALFCGKDKSPYCVASDGVAFKNCSFAQADNAKLQFGKGCVDGKVERYKELDTAVTAICDKESARDLLCDDCKLLKTKLDQAQAKNSSGGTSGGASEGNGGATR